MRTATFTVLASAALAAAQPGFVVVQRDGACAVGSTVPYIVQSGDTLTKIATALGSGICDIAKASGLASPDFILNGASLTVPIKLASPDNKSCVKQAPPATAVCVVGGDKTYTIKSGDTLYLVSVALGITLDSLLSPPTRASSPRTSTPATRSTSPFAKWRHRTLHNSSWWATKVVEFVCWL
ncbi:uncharacterized protein PG998_003172 [Apiospora kogelbergensis]|uniref:uncharacterized protein n=1 Tax=Apiospora kogelbergensis TaxID=1337665 RepID=UPI0031309156